ncbi:thiamine-phosphate kinase [Ectothiorhodospiraceae bacterium 2226]|nr:thiamine-phosphate kinase [Ectothiorhodospiraceae bacterium 2226]
MGEFDLIARHFARLGAQRRDVTLGVGDDAALLAPPAGQHLVVAVDTLVAGVHFPTDTAAADIGHKALAVNLSDLAAMGAQPAWFTLSLTLPRADEAWLTAFAGGLRALAEAHGVQLVGGDTTRGPLTISVQVLGFAPPEAALRRSGARPGDGVYVSGTLGDAALGLAAVQGRVELPGESARRLRTRLDRPTPRVALGLALRGLATSAIDLSDGLAGDLTHILAASGVGAVLDCTALPLAAEVRAWGETEPAAWRLALSGGDDYELCFTAPPAQQAAVERACAQAGVPCTRIGSIVAGEGLQLRGRDGVPLPVPLRGYEHFAEERDADPR